MAFERRRGAHVLTTDPARISLDDVEAFLRQSYWAANRSREKIARTLETSLCFAVIDETSRATIAFARVVSDFADFAWLCDVFVAPDYQKQGIGAWMVEAILEHPDLQSLRRMILATSSAHRLYERFGFTPLADPAVWMERVPAPA